MINVGKISLVFREQTEELRDKSIIEECLKKEQEYYDMLFEMRMSISAGI